MIELAWNDCGMSNCEGDAHMRFTLHYIEFPGAGLPEREEILGPAVPQPSPQLIGISLLEDEAKFALTALPVDPLLRSSSR
jgi:hypothetical protein